MPRFTDLDEEFVCPYRDGCPYLEGLPTAWIWQHHNDTVGQADQYEYQLRELQQQLDQSHRENRKLEQENQQLKAQLQALHRRQFQGRRHPPPAPADPAPAPPKKRGAPVGHPGWQRAKPERMDHVIPVPAPTTCPECHHAHLEPVTDVRDHIQEDIVVEPRTVVTCYRHQQAHCPRCDQNVIQPGPGELLGAYIGPAAKATATYLRYELNISERKLSRFFADFFGLKFVPASAYGFERQAVRRGQPLYADLLAKVRALPVVHADETGWRHDGQNYWVWYGGNDDWAVFHFDAHRSGEAAQHLLGTDLPGILVSDAYAAYNAVASKDWQSCLAHLNTTAKEVDQELALLKGRAADPSARQFCQRLRGFVHEACQAHHRLARSRWRARTARRQERVLRRQLEQLCQMPFRYPKAEALRKRLLGPEQKHFFTFLRRKNVPPTNNQAERSLRPVVIMRRVIFGTRSVQGLENHSVLRSLFETARRQGKKPHQFFLDLFTKTTAQAQTALYRHKLPAKAKVPRRC